MSHKFILSWKTTVKENEPFVVVVTSLDHPLTIAFLDWCGDKDFPEEIQQVKADGYSVLFVDKIRKWFQQTAMEAALNEISNNVNIQRES